MSGCCASACVAGRQQTKGFLADGQGLQAVWRGGYVEKAAVDLAAGNGLQLLARGHFMQADFDQGAFCAEGAAEVGHLAVDHGAGDAHVQPALHAFGHAAHHVGRMLQLGEHLACLDQEGLARRGEAHVLGVAVHEAGAQVLLQGF